jgi:putative transposase
MSIKRKIYSANFKAKLVLEVLEGLETINEVASQYGVLPVSIKNWKNNF